MPIDREIATMLPQCSHITKKRGVFYYRRRLPRPMTGEIALSLSTRKFRRAEWLTINGEEVCEIDIRASYLTIYHAHHGAQLDHERDPYELRDFPAEARSVIKLWFVATFGNNGHLDRWPKEIAAEYREKHGRQIGKRYPIKRIRERALEQFPLLERWGSEDFGWPDLMYIESQAVFGAMKELMAQGIPSLTVHDSLIVPVSKRETAEVVLSEHYRKTTDADPVLRVNYPLPSEPTERIWSEDDLRDYDAAEREDDRPDDDDNEPNSAYERDEEQEDGDRDYTPATIMADDNKDEDGASDYF